MEVLSGSRRVVVGRWQGWYRPGGRDPGSGDRRCCRAQPISNRASSSVPLSPRNTVAAWVPRSGYGKGLHFSGHMTFSDRGELLKRKENAGQCNTFHDD